LEKGDTNGSLFWQICDLFFINILKKLISFAKNYLMFIRQTHYVVDSQGQKFHVLVKIEDWEKLTQTIQDIQNQLITQNKQLEDAHLTNANLQQIQNESVTQNAHFTKQLQDAATVNVDLQHLHNQSVAQNAHLSQQLQDAQDAIRKIQTEKEYLQQVQNQFITQNTTLSDGLKTARTEIERLRKLLDLKLIPQPKPIVIPTPIVPKPIIITPPIIKTKLPFEPELILVEGGTFKMGSDEYSNSSEKPIHQVTLSSYMIGKYPITQAQWQAVMGSNPSYFKEGGNLPVERVSWDDTQDFISNLNEKTGKTYSLPTEAQWEFAARGGNKSKGFKYSGSNNADDVGWHNGNSDSETHPVGEKDKNELGIHDMSGNVWEWCADWYGSYDSATVTNPIGVVEGSCRVLRGGSWNYRSMYCRVADRLCNSPSYRNTYYGFRVVSFP
jgi:formylglycine-generating enzyme required for sulfatase activity